MNCIIVYEEAEKFTSNSGWSSCQIIQWAFLFWHCIFWQIRTNGYMTYLIYFICTCQGFVLSCQAINMPSVWYVGRLPHIIYLVFTFKQGDCKLCLHSWSMKTKVHVNSAQKIIVSEKCLCVTVYKLIWLDILNTCSAQRTANYNLNMTPISTTLLTLSG